MRFFNWRDMFWFYVEEQHLFYITELILKQCLNSKVLHGTSESTCKPGVECKIDVRSIKYLFSLKEAP